ncbi:hypothetical protein M427DRAFT_155677 [Gonapodya prolifera JEL478]|uniref:Uncharacterized protein n=1 Tax=Gonapodya prolifera (strain JEL478) TaxID=1344416 RepID=A0A139AEN0_GONPJ|nr:hypothetical protein M427DRAFT_155677 [Gonapodya prolifera JEL478]|eukprot:KXS15044.1 hypothetical protein M427DRAFT_155677 [Gonapodya prolifera JEL478]
MGTAELLGLAHAAIILIAAVALGKYAGASNSECDSITVRAEVLLRAFGCSEHYSTVVFNPSIAGLVQWILGGLKEESSGVKAVTDH